MHLLFALLIAIAANLDNGGVGVAYGLRKVRIPILANLLIAAIGAAGTGLFGVMGGHLSKVLPLWLDSWAGAVVITGVGVWVLIDGRKDPGRPVDGRGSGRPALAGPGQAGGHAPGDIALGEALLLGVALGVNAWAGGFGAGLLGIPLLPVVILTGVMSVVLLALGAFLGTEAASRLLGSRATLIAGLLLIGIGIHQIL